MRMACSWLALGWSLALCSHVRLITSTSSTCSNYCYTRIDRCYQTKCACTVGRTVYLGIFVLSFLFCEREKERRRERELEIYCVFKAFLYTISAILCSRQENAISIYFFQFGFIGKFNSSLHPTKQPDVSLFAISGRAGRIGG